MPPPPPALEETAPGAVVPAPLAWPRPSGGRHRARCLWRVVVPGVAPVPAEVTAAGFVLADLDSGAVLAARAPHARHRPASALKVLTALVAVDRLDPSATVAGAPEDLSIDGSRAGIGPGGTYTVRELLAGLLLNSGNDTAQALARAMGGDAATVAAMTDTARVLGAFDTRPATPSGLDGPGMSSSAYDLALLFRQALREPLFAEIIATCDDPFPGYGDRPGFVLSNANPLLARYPGTLGGKTGFTDAARHTIVGAAERDGRRLVVAVVRAENTPVLMWQQAARCSTTASPARPTRPRGHAGGRAPPPPTAATRRGALAAPRPAAAVGAPAAVVRPARRAARSPAGCGGRAPAAGGSRAGAAAARESVLTRRAVCARLARQL